MCEADAGMLCTVPCDPGLWTNNGTLRPRMSDDLTKMSDGLDRVYRETIRPSKTPQDQLRFKFFEYITNLF